MNAIHTTRRLAIALILSGAFNVLLLSLLFYVAVKERPPTPYFESKPADEHLTPLTIDHSNHEVIRYFKKMPMEGLIGRLANRQQVENGYTQRDLALAALVAFHDFDIERALSAFPPLGQKRKIEYGKYRNGKAAELTVFPGLSEPQFEAITAFARRERWPLTAKGLFQKVKRDINAHDDPSLVESFLMTPEFIAIYLLFERAEAKIDQQAVLALISEGNWEQLSAFVSGQKMSQDLSAARRQRLLLDYIEKNSKSAARLLVKSDPAFARLKSDDSQVLFLLTLLDPEQPESRAFAEAILASPRTDAVRKGAAEFLQVVMPEEKKTAPLPIAKAASPEPVTLTRAPQVTSAPKPAPIDKPPSGKLIASSVPSKASNSLQAASKSDQLYIVQEGDSLWKISRRFGVDIETLKAVNRLETEFLSPGRTLKIPTPK